MCNGRTQLAQISSLLFLSNENRPGRRALNLLLIFDQNPDSYSYKFFLRKKKAHFSSQKRSTLLQEPRFLPSLFK